MRYQELKNIRESLSIIKNRYETMLDGRSTESIILLHNECVILIDSIYSVLIKNLIDIKSDRVLNVAKDIRSCIKVVKTTVDSIKALILKLQIFDSIILQEITFSIRVLICAEIKEKWDSLESIYNYMKTESRFDPVIVTTPVFRKLQLSDGTVKKETIYEDFLSNKGIPFIHYYNYDIDKDKPDVAIISQPYESSTEKEFWPENLASKTRLIYSSYFAFIGMDDFDFDFFGMNAYSKAWMVAGQSSQFLDFYKDYLKKNNSDNNGENMILTGLPKTDWMVNLNDKLIDIPKDWNAVKQGKKAILLNTWYDLSNSSVKHIVYIKEWLDDHKDFALIWRSHPLTEIVTKLYFGKEANEYYRNVMELAQSSENIIIDKEASCEPCFKHSCALISDYSSLMSQYLLVDKPILWVQSNENLTINWISDVSRDYRFTEITKDVEGIISFLDHIAAGIDNKALDRLSAREEYLPLCDGYSGKRLADAIWEGMIKE